MKPTILLTGCAGFIGSNFVKKIASDEAHRKQWDFLILDALTYAGRKQTIQPELDLYPEISFVQGDLRNVELVQSIFQKTNIHGVIHFAAESHVDRSILNPNIFIETNVLGTLNLLNASLTQFSKVPNFKFVHVSTDEVYGSLGEKDAPFTEDHPIQPNSPYSASKASSDLLVRSYVETFKLPACITRCSNNYGPYQFPEKLIPLMTINALQNKSLPVYGDGRNVRDWIHVDDHNRGVWKTFLSGKTGEVYNFGGNAERRNIDIVREVLKHTNKPDSLIQFVEDRKGHDWRYAMDYTKATKELGWKPLISFEEGLLDTVKWYQKNSQWLEMIKQPQS